MKKSLIAGAGVAALAMAAVPFAGVFAEDITTMTDTINISIESSCTFNAASHAYTETMEANDLNAEVGETSMNVLCNAYNGYYVTAAFTSLTGNGSNAITYSSDTPTAGSGTWTAYNSSTTANLTNGARPLQNQSHTSASGDSTTITYKVGTADDQAAGTYTGTATYTLTTPYAAAS